MFDEVGCGVHDPVHLQHALDAVQRADGVADRRNEVPCGRASDLATLARGDVEAASTGVDRSVRSRAEVPAHPQLGAVEHSGNVATEWRQGSGKRDARLGQSLFGSEVVDHGTQRRQMYDLCRVPHREGSRRGTVRAVQRINVGDLELIS